MYELTELLIAIASIAASFVAILGGFIVSKLLAIAAERETVEYDLEAIIENRDRLVSEIKGLQSSIDEEDALGFVFNHINELIEQKHLDNVYDSSEKNDISFGKLLPFWEKAVLLIDELGDIFQGTDIEFNSDNIPTQLAQKYSSDTFSYEILKMTLDHLKKQDGKYSIYNVALTMPRIVGIWYSEAKDTIEINNNQIKECDFNISQLNRKKQSLIIPKGIISGLIIFALFTITSIILPLCICPYLTDDYKSYCIVKYLFIGIFVIGLLAIFIYLIYLLKWKHRKNNTEE